MTFIIVAVVLLVLVAILSKTLRLKLGSKGETEERGEWAVKFKAKALLTDNELEFLCRLESAVPELRFHAQVSMGAILNPDLARDDRRYLPTRGRFSQKIVDFVAQSRKDGSIVALIELDDRTHNRANDAKRDAMLASAGYRIIRWHSNAKPGSIIIRKELMPEQKPPVLAAV